MLIFRQRLNRSSSIIQSGPKIGLHCVAWNNATNQGKSRVNKSHSCGELRFSQGLYTFNTQANAFATVCIKSHQNFVNYSFTQSTNMNSPFL